MLLLFFPLSYEALNLCSLLLDIGL
jgi:hypothetical protein